MLVEDEHVDFVQSLLADRPRKGRQHFDIYSVSGRPGSDLAGTPCFPPRLARKLLTSAVWLRDSYRVPDLEGHFLGLAYHAAYHKGYASGLSAQGGADELRRHASHDYETVLADLAARLGEPVTPTLEGLDRYLADHDLRPSPDMLGRLAPTNPWIADRFEMEVPSTPGAERRRGPSSGIVLKRWRDAVAQAGTRTSSAGVFSRISTITVCTSTAICPSTFRRIRTCWEKR
jgi:hypothetical protein